MEVCRGTLVEPVIRFQGVYKEYPFYQHIITAGFKSFLFNLPKNIASLKKTRFMALNGISFDIRKGETFGIIGRNGSGKSTILGLMARVIREDRGTVLTRGKISSLLELGAGFHPDLSGVENIILNGILMGNTKDEMLRKIDRIVEFSELGDFIFQPLRTYSSGMQVRLGFSVAVHVDPEILLIDEALSVGDLNFQEKCLKKMKEFRESGATIVIVSHDLSAIAKLCDRATWIENGSIMKTGRPREVIREYMTRSGLGAEFASFDKDLQVTAEDVAAAEEKDEPAIVSTAEDFQASSGGPLSWWDLPVVIRECENLITGDPDLSLYDFLKKEYIPAPLQKGLSICHRLKGVESLFVRYGVCRSFDVIDEAELVPLLAGKREFRENAHDFILCIDLLRRVGDLDLFLGRLDRALSEGGILIAMEDIGPDHSQGANRARDIADKIFMNLDVPNPSLSSFPPEDVMSGPACSNGVRAALERLFQIVTVRYFGGPLYDLLVNRIAGTLDAGDRKDSALLKTIIQFEQILLQEGILENHYAMVLAKKREL